VLTQILFDIIITYVNDMIYTGGDYEKDRVLHARNGFSGVHETSSGYSREKR
jgi:hypothetical protein